MRYAIYFHVTIAIGGLGRNHSRLDGSVHKSTQSSHLSVIVLTDRGMER